MVDSRYKNKERNDPRAGVDLAKRQMVPWPKRLTRRGERDCIASMIDLGTKPEPPEAVGAPTKEEPKIQYPSFTLRDENVDKLKEETGHDCQVDDVYLADVKLRVSGVRSDEYGKSIELEVVEMDEIEPEGGASEDEPPDKTAKGKSSKALRYAD